MAKARKATAVSTTISRYHVWNMMLDQIGTMTDGFTRAAGGIRKLRRSERVALCLLEAAICGATSSRSANIILDEMVNRLADEPEGLDLLKSLKKSVDLTLAMSKVE